MYRYVLYGYIIPGINIYIYMALYVYVYNCIHICISASLLKYAHVNMPIYEHVNARMQACAKVTPAEYVYTYVNVFCLLEMNGYVLGISRIYLLQMMYMRVVLCVCANTFIDTSTQNLANVLSCNHHSQQVDFKLAFRLRIDSYSLASQTKVKSIQKTSAELGTTSTSAAKIPNITSALSFMRMAGLCSRESSTELLQGCNTPERWPSCSLGLKASHDPKFHGISLWSDYNPKKVLVSPTFRIQTNPHLPYCQILLVICRYNPTIMSYYSPIRTA